MKNDFSLTLEDNYAQIWMGMWMVALGMFWIGLFMLSVAGVAGLGNVIKVWIFLACLWAVVAGWRSAAALARAATVLKAWRTPDRLWRAWLTQSLRELALPWAANLACAVMVLALPDTPWAWTTGAAWISMVLSLTILLALSRHGLLHQVWAWGIALGGTALLVGLSATVGIDNAVETFGQAPVLLQILLSCSYVLLAYVGVQRWKVPPVVRRSGERQARARWVARVTRQTRRYTHLEHTVRNQAQGQPPVGSRQSYWVTQAFPVLWMPTLSRMWSTGEEVTALRLLGLGMLAVFFISVLVCKDLHWRYVLTPGGPKGGSFGQRIFLATALHQTVFWIGVGLVYVLAKVIWSDALFGSVMMDALVSIRFVPLELMTVLALAVAMRAVGRLFPLVCLACLIVVAVPVLWVYGLEHPPVIFTAGPAYVFVLLSITIGAVFLANRLWTTQKLLPFLQVS